MNFKSSDIVVIGESNDILKRALIVLDSDLTIKYLNSYAQWLLTYGKEQGNWVGHKLPHVCEILDIPSLVEPATLVAYRGPLPFYSFVKTWNLNKVTIDGENCFFLTDTDVTKIETLYDLLKERLKRFTGQNINVKDQRSLMWYFEEVYRCLKPVITTTPGYVFWKDSNYKYVLCNENYAKLLGCKDVNEVIGKTDYELGLDYQTVNVIREFDKAIIESGKQEINSERIISSIDHTKPDFPITLRPLRNSNDKLIGVLGISSENRLKTELSLKQENNFDILEDTFHLFIGRADPNKLSEKQYVSELSYCFKSIISQMPGYIYLKDINFKYVFCNNAVAESLGYNSPYEIQGKTDYDFGWSTDLVDKYREIDEEIVKSGIPKFGIEETIIVHKGKELNLIVNKMPLFSKSGEVIGIIGVDIDITDRKEAEILRMENEAQKSYSEKLASFKLIAGQVAHDIRSPLSSLKMLLNSCDNLPESQRLALQHSITSITDIANNLLNRFTPEAREQEQQPKQIIRTNVLLSAALLDIISEKKYEYQSLNIDFEFNCDKNSYFGFANLDNTAFNRMISNLINNAVDAFEDKDGKIIIHLESDDNLCKVCIQDFGKGMPKQVIDKILNEELVTKDKNEGHGLGLTQVREALKANDGQISIESELEIGTKITLSFPRIEAGRWFASQIRLKKNDSVVILDDDPSIHGAWAARFAKELPDVKLKHFRIGQDAVEYLNSLSAAEKKHILLLTDYELLKQNINGLEVIEQTKIKRSILVTSHYINKQILEDAAKTNTRILPKLLASEVSIEADEGKEKYKSVRKVDLVILDDDERLVNDLLTLLLHDKKVDKYHNPQQLFDKLSQYSKDTKILIDNYFPATSTNGQEIAEYLHARGFNNLYLFSGTDFSKQKLPRYLQAILKSDIEKLKGLVN